jgi:hypothetical protein
VIFTTYSSSLYSLSRCLAGVLARRENVMNSASSPAGCGNEHYGFDQPGTLPDGSPAGVNKVR